MSLGRKTEGLPLAEELLKRLKSTLGPAHADTVGAMNTLASAYMIDGRPAEAIKLVDESYRSLKAKLGPALPRRRRAPSAATGLPTWPQMLNGEVRSIWLTTVRLKNAGRPASIAG